MMFRGRKDDQTSPNTHLEGWSRGAMTWASLDNEEICEANLCPDAGNDDASSGQQPLYAHVAVGLRN
jgi:hypothetical protein